jgi:predicted phosphodiesterase
MKTWIVIPDLHFPYQCKLYVKLISKVIAKIKPYGIVQLGDAIDCFQISKYPKDPERVNFVFDDILDYKYQLDEWAELCRGPYYQLEGNHEARLSRFIWEKAPALNKMVKTMPELLGLSNSLGLKWFPISKWDSCRIGDTVLHHGVFYNKHVGVQGLDRYPTKFICGHTHRLQLAYNSDRFHITLGHGSNEEMTAHNATPTGWSQAFGLLHDVNGKCHLETVSVINGRCVLHGEVIKC